MYLLDYTRMENYGASRSTLGAEFKGKRKVSDATKLLYELEYAAQGDYGDNPNSVEAAYYFLMVGLAFKPVTLKVGNEVLGGDAATENNKGAFITPLATLHKFNGWADKFLNTPGDGLEDLLMQTDSEQLEFRRGVPSDELFADDATDISLALPRNGELVTVEHLDDDGRADLVLRYNESDGDGPSQTVRLLLTR